VERLEVHGSEAIPGLQSQTVLAPARAVEAIALPGTEATTAVIEMSTAPKTNKKRERGSFGEVMTDIVSLHD
jgi:hypothetical protein